MDHDSWIIPLFIKTLFSCGLFDRYNYTEFTINVFIFIPYVQYYVAICTTYNIGLVRYNLISNTFKTPYRIVMHDCIISKVNYNPVNYLKHLVSSLKDMFISFTFMSIEYYDPRAIYLLVN